MRDVWGFSAKTYTPAFGTILLAKAVDPGVDPETIKVLSNNPHTFSLRTLCHGVLVPEAARLGFSIRATGREPLNNQPFFRYAHVSEIDRVKDSRALALYQRILRRHVGPLDRAGSRDALAAYLRVGLDEADRLRKLTSLDVATGAAELVTNLSRLLGEGGAGPWVVQALGAVFLEAFYSKVMTRRLNDPSRDFPGDVQGLDRSGAPVITLEARNKAVSPSDLEAFVGACARQGIHRAILLMLGARPLAAKQMASEAAWATHGVSLLIIDSVSEAVNQALALSPRDLDDLLDTWVGRMAERLAEIEAPEAAREFWADLNS